MKYFLDFDLPKEKIATQPSPDKNQDKMIICRDGMLSHDIFANIENYLEEGDLIIVNNSKVFKARLDIYKNDLHSEMLLLEQDDDYTWTAMIKKAKRFKPDTVFTLKNGADAYVSEILDGGIRRIKFIDKFSPADADSIGHIPLPPYIIDERKSRGEILYSDADEERYQTVFARHYGSAAAPTASLRFSEETVASLQKKGVIFKEITLHVGLGTFKPMDSAPDDYQIHKEYASVSADTIDAVKTAKQHNKRVIAAGTTVCRALESGGLAPFEGYTDIFIKPGYEFKVIDGLITNFHLPHSTLLLLVQAFTGIKECEQIYMEALAGDYRFFSYGDGMLLFK